MAHMFRTRPGYRVISPFISSRHKRSRNNASVRQVLERANALLPEHGGQSAGMVESVAQYFELRGVAWAWQLVYLESSCWASAGASLGLRTAVCETLSSDLDAEPLHRKEDSVSSMTPLHLDDDEDAMFAQTDHEREIDQSTNAVSGSSSHVHALVVPTSFHHAAASITLDPTLPILLRHASLVSSAALTVVQALVFVSFIRASYEGSCISNADCTRMRGTFCRVSSGQCLGCGFGDGCGVNMTAAEWIANMPLRPVQVEKFKAVGNFQARL